MKKVLIFFILLLLIGGTIFFLGWAQLTIPPGSYGVMRTKTHGLDNQVIRDGEFRWVWYKAIPTNAAVLVYTIIPVKHDIFSSGSLSSGQVYASLAGLEADFSWEISGELIFTINPEYLPELTLKNNISDNEGLRKLEENLAVKAESLVIQYLKTYMEDDNGSKLESIVIASSLPELESQIEKLMPEIENFTCTLKNISLPDYTLYQSIKALYSEYIARQSAVLALDITNEAEKRINTRMRLEELAQYGELLTKYPILLEYLAIEKEINSINNN